MIAVEKKFILDNTATARLLKDAEFINEKVFTDTYYDTDNLLLTLNNKWLRLREDKFELKLPVGNASKKIVDQYEELEDEQLIRKALDLTITKDFVSVLEESGYLPFCICKTTRKKYTNQSFIIDLDIVEFPEFQYNIVEIELMVSHEPEIQDAINRIMSFAKKHKLDLSPVRGKVVEYLKQRKPNHYNSLVKAGVVKEL